MRKALTFSLILMGLAVLPAFAALQSTISSGGTVQQGFMDIKGEPVIGAGNGIQLGGIYVLGGPPPSIGGAPPGTVPLIISRSGSDIQLTWDNSVANVEIYSLDGDGTGQFDNKGNFQKRQDLSFNGNTATDSKQVGQIPNERYYKAVIPGYANYNLGPQYNNLTCLQAAWSVGKLNVTVNQNGGKQLVAIPLYDGKLSTIFPTQLKGGKSLIISPRSGSGLNPIIVNETGVIGQDFVVQPMVGFWMQTSINAAAPVTITFVGGLITSYLEYPLATKDLTGNPLPLSFSTSNLGVDGDILSVQSGLGLSPMIKSSGSWGQFSNVGLNQGFWYSYKTNNRKWAIKPDSLDVKLLGY